MRFSNFQRQKNPSKRFHPNSSQCRKCVVVVLIKIICRKILLIRRAAVGKIKRARGMTRDVPVSQKPPGRFRWLRRDVIKIRFLDTRCAGVLAVE